MIALAQAPLPDTTPQPATRLAQGAPNGLSSGAPLAGAGGSGRPRRAVGAEFPVVPGYRLIRELGRGGMGVVYEAEDVALHRSVALKLVSGDAVSGAAAADRMRVEAEAVARLRHPNVVPIYGVHEFCGRPVLAFELVKGGSLADLLKSGPLPVAAAVAVVRAVAAGVRHAHEHGVIHRDLKPANILLGELGPDGVSSILPFAPKVTDFGLAKLLGSAGSRTRSGMMLGTVCYMAPEVIEHPGAVSPAADVYSLGVILFECLTARLPLDKADLLPTMLSVLGDEPPPLAEFLPGAPQALDAIYRKALAKTPAGRYPSVQAFADDLDRYSAGEGVRARRPRPAGPRYKWVRRAAAAGVAGAVALGCNGYGMYSSAQDAAGAGGERFARGEFSQAEELAESGLRRVRDLPGCEGLSERLERLLAAARRGRGAAGLSRLVEQLRYGVGPDSVGDAELRKTLAACEAVWAARERFRAGAELPLSDADEDRLRTDLLDLAVISADLKLQLEGGPAGKAQAVARLGEAEALLGPLPAFGRLRASFEADRGATAAAPDPAMTPWELYTLGRARLSAGDPAGAAPFLRQASRLEPRAFWPNYYEAMASLRCGRPEEAASGFSVCLAVAPSRQGLCFYNRSLAYEAMGKQASAERDLDAALELEPGLAVARYRRGVARSARADLAGARGDLERARELGYPKPELWYELAFAREADRDHAGAIEAASGGVRADPSNARYRELLSALRAGHVLSRPSTPLPRNLP